MLRWICLGVNEEADLPLEVMNPAYVLMLLAVVQNPPAAGGNLYAPFVESCQR